MIKPLEIPQDTPKPANLVETRELTAEEIDRYVRPIYEQVGQALPDAVTATFVGVVHGGEVVAFLGLQIKLHAEPLWIKDGEANRLIGLVHKAEEIILEKCGPQWVYLHAPAGRVAQIAAHLGMQLEPWVVMTKLVAPPLPAKAAIEIQPPGETPIDGIIQ